MIWTGWNNGEHHATGAGYGFKINASDRNSHFKLAWRTVFIELPQGNGFVTAEADIAKASFWGRECREIISKHIGLWMLAEGYAPWPNDEPPKFEVESLGDRRFRVKTP
jgi:hypothetical protein